MTFPFDANANEVEPADQEQRWTDGAPFFAYDPEAEITRRKSEAKRFKVENPAVKRLHILELL